jgi:hypothetical protein
VHSPILKKDASGKAFEAHLNTPTIAEVAPLPTSPSWGERIDRGLSRRADNTRPDTPNREWILLHQQFGETPNRATGTVALSIRNCIVP